MTNRFPLYRLTALSAMIASSPVAAGGLYIWEFGHPAQGASGAGAGALAQDASTALLNSAGIMFLDDSETMVSGLVIDSSVKFRQDPSSALQPNSVTDADGNRPAHDGGNAGSTAVGATFFHARPVNDKWGWGVSMVSISGAALEYRPQEDFVGRYWASEVELLTINLTPSLAYRVNDEFSIGVSVPIMFGMLDMDVAIPGPLEAVSDGWAEISNGDDILATISLSAMWQPTPALRLGAMYLGEMEIEFESDLDLSPPPGVSANQVAADVAFTYPQTIRTWTAYELNDRLTLLGTLAWEDWSAFDSIAISTPVVGASLPRNWDDTWHFGAGLRIKTAGPWTWHTGVAYDTDPTRARDRTADMPIDRQWRISLGADRHRENGHRYGMVATYADYGDGDIDNGGVRPGTGIPWAVTGRYTTNRLVFLGFNYGW